MSHPSNKIFMARIQEENKYIKMSIYSYNKIFMIFIINNFILTYRIYSVQDILPLIDNHGGPYSYR